MKMFSSISFILSSFIVVTSAFNHVPRSLQNSPTDGKLWAVLIAGSQGWDNYRHQADICHAYQVLKNHGVPDERIIVLMYDDIAGNSENPTKGIVINHPQGQDVYKGVPKDYTGEDVTPENFMAVLRGDRKALSGIGSGKVLQSGPNDHVFIYFSDHGAPGLIAFPEGELSAMQLNKTITYMHKNQKYGKMVIYIEACESGSMFEDLLPNGINIYATTAANGEESSYACYFDDERETYLGDHYSVNWLEDSDKENLAIESLLQQYKIVKKETNDSHVQEFGDLKLAKLPVSEFQGRKNTQPIVYPKVEKGTVRSRDVPIEIAKRKYLKSNSQDEQTVLLKKLHKMLRNRLFLKEKVTEIVSEIFKHEHTERDILHNRHKLRNFDCYDEIRDHFKAECFELSKNPYALEYMYVLVNICENHVPPRAAKRAMDKVCTHPPVHGIV